MPAHKCCLFTGAVEEERRDVYVCLVPVSCLKKNVLHVCLQICPNLGGFSHVCDGLILVDFSHENMSLITVSQTNDFISHAPMLTFFSSGRQFRKPRKVD